MGRRRACSKIDRNCSARGAALSALERYPKILPQTPHRRVDPMGPQGPPVPSAPLRAVGAPLRGRVPPMDYRDNPPPSVQNAPAAE